MRNIGAQTYFALAGTVAAGGAVTLDPMAARAAADQTWPAFALVAGLLLVGAIAAADGLFSAAGNSLAARARHPAVPFAGTCVMVVAVTAVLNLDTSVAFLTPIAVHLTRRRDLDPVALLAACVLLSNAGSLPLPGSNLTNLIVLGRLHLSGTAYLAHMAWPWAATVTVTVLVIAYRRRGDLTTADTSKIPLRADSSVTERSGHESADGSPVAGIGLLAVLASIGLVVVLRSPALPVLAVGTVAAGWRAFRHQTTVNSLRETLGLPTLVGLMGLAVAFGTFARAWSGPATVLGRLDPIATAAVVAASTILINNLPAAALWAAHRPANPFSVLIGLDVGPNMFASGSLAWLLWSKSARRAGVEPPIRATISMGLVASIIAIPVAVGTLYLTGSAR